MRLTFERDDRAYSTTKIRELENGKWRLTNWHYEFDSDNCRIVIYLENNEQYWRDELGRVRL